MGRERERKEMKIQEHEKTWFFVFPFKFCQQTKKVLTKTRAGPEKEERKIKTKIFLKPV